MNHKLEYLYLSWNVHTSSRNETTRVLLGHIIKSILYTLWKQPKVFFFFCSRMHWSDFNLDKQSVYGSNGPYFERDKRSRDVGRASEKTCQSIADNFNQRRWYICHLSDQKRHAYANRNITKKPIRSFREKRPCWKTTRTWYDERSDNNVT